MIVDNVVYIGFLVTGKLHNSNKRFSLSYGDSPSGFHTAMAINLWNGRVWGITPDGKKKLLKRVTN